jgi:hypothetical protein
MVIGYVAWVRELVVVTVSVELPARVTDDGANFQLACEGDKPESERVTRPPKPFRAPTVTV